MTRVEVVIALTLWLSFGAYLFFPTVNAPQVFCRAAIGLFASELATLAAWSFLPSCILPGCGEAAGIAYNAASLQIPALTGVMLAVAALYGLRVARTW